MHRRLWVNLGALSLHQHHHHLPGGAQGFVHKVLHASVNVDYSLRRQGKRFLANLFFMRQWRDLISPRAKIERHFAWLKCYFGLKYFRVQGYFAITQLVFGSTLRR
jgi:hypothetical protein